jgi:hypothetical protein
MKRTRLLSGVIGAVAVALVVCLFWSNLAHRPMHFSKSVSPTGSKSPPHSETAFSALWSGQKELAGFGLYSYLLLGSAPRDDAARARDLAAIGAISALPAVAQMRRYFSREQLNITYIPIVASDSKPVDIQTSEEMLDAYDFARARSLLDSIDSSLKGGPYIISVIQPLSAASVRQRYLFQDLGFATPRLASQWVALFQVEAARPNFWEAERGQRFALDLRNDVDLVAHDIMPNMPSNIAEMIGWRPAGSAK